MRIVSLLSPLFQSGRFNKKQGRRTAKLYNHSLSQITHLRCGSISSLSANSPSGDKTTQYLARSKIWKLLFFSHD
nr:MAG TPA: hypothetical protein [Caudoviricetes sp.]